MEREKKLTLEEERLLLIKYVGALEFDQIVGNKRGIVTIFPGLNNYKIGDPVILGKNEVIDPSDLSHKPKTCNVSVTKIINENKAEVVSDSFI